MDSYKLFNKKAQGPEIFWYIFLYLPLTIIVITSLVIIPRSLMAKSLQPVPLDQMIQSRQLQSQMWTKNPVTGKTNLMDYQITKDLNKTYTTKQITYRVQLGNQETYYNKELYELAKPISPFRYLPYLEERITNQGKLTIEEYYPKQYAIDKK